MTLAITFREKRWIGSLERISVLKLMAVFPHFPDFDLRIERPPGTDQLRAVLPYRARVRQTAS